MGEINRRERLLEVMESIVCSERDPRDIYRILIGCIGPRPIGWISTISKEGKFNLAPYSFFNMFSMNPAIIGFSAAIKRDMTHKDSLRNAKETQCFVHNVVTQDLIEPMNSSSEEFPHGVSEFEKVGLTPLASLKVKAPRVKEAALSLECQVTNIVSLGEAAGNGQLVLGEVVMIHIHRPEILADDHFIDSRKLELVSRIGRTDYMGFGEVITMKRPF